MSNQQTYIFAGKTFNSIGEFADSYYGGDLIRAQDVMNMLIEQGTMQVRTSTTKEEELINKAVRQQASKDLAQEIYAQEELEKDFRLEQRREGKLTYDEVEFEFGTLSSAQEFAKEINNLSVAHEIIIRDNKYIAIAKSITEKDLNKLSLSYKAQKTVTKTLDFVDRTASGAVGTVNYTAEKVLVPTVTVATKASVGIAQTLAMTTVKSASTILTGLFRGVKSTASEMKTDSDVIKAKYELINTKEEFLRNVNNKRAGSMGGSGITIK